MGRGKSDQDCHGLIRRSLGSFLDDELLTRAQTAAASLHDRPDTLCRNAELAEVLRGLYSRAGTDVAARDINRFLDESAESLRTVYRRHAQLNIARCLDEYEGVLVLERLRNDRAHLLAAWPFAEDELKAVADAAGVRLALAGSPPSDETP